MGSVIKRLLVPGFGWLMILLVNRQVLVLAQPQEGVEVNRPAGTAGRSERIQPPPGAGARFLAGFERLSAVLTEEQRSSLRQSIEQQQGKLHELEDKLHASRKELLESGLTEKFDESAVRKKAQAAANLEAEISVLRIKALSQIKPALSAEQLRKLSNSPGIGGLDAQREFPRRRPELPRDEHGLPPKERVTSEPAKQ